MVWLVVVVRHWGCASVHHDVHFVDSNVPNIWVVASLLLATGSVRTIMIWLGRPASMWKK
jgi:hypothetical protein